MREHALSISAATDLSDGGLALAAFEMAERGNIGLTVNVSGTAALFGEDQGRYLLAVTEAVADDLEAAAETSGVAFARIGQFGGDMLTLGSVSAPMAELSSTYRGAFAAAVA